MSDISMPTVIVKRHTDENGQLTAEQIVGESKQVVYRHVVLEQVPHIRLGIKVLVSGNPNPLIKIDLSDTIENSQQYKVDFSQSKIWFHPSIEGKFVAVDYWGIGHELIHSSRVYTQALGSVPTQTLDDILKDYVKLQGKVSQLEQRILQLENN